MLYYRWIYLWCYKLKSRGTSLKNMAPWSFVVQHAKLVCFRRLTVGASSCKENIFKNTCGNWAIDTFSCFRRILYGGFMEGFWWENANLWSAIRNSDRLLGTPLQLSQFPRPTDHWLCAFWTAGIKGRPLDIVSTSCTTIFQISNRTSRCILESYGGC